MQKTILVDGDLITDWESFHSLFARLLGFPDFYGRNMNAWIDCMSDLDDPNSGMTKVTLVPGEILILQVENVTQFKLRCPEICLALLEGLAFVNARRLESGEAAVLTLSILY